MTTLSTVSVAACEAVDAAPYDLVLLDVVMPGRSCADTLAHIRKARPDARVLLSSGYTADTNVADLLRDGKTAFLRKPYDPPALLRAIRGALER
jgi:CheY-like chemotaxis protein